ncbi:MAG: helix-turn-helix transcriptional regulator [Labilithrix sp.]|nr:helix-turn-helix transcriptional regulator [Labilithrix sp.]MCW5810558.1 helix-turn-helix transcriptional regulator [Labilithrix sp.]
MASSTFDLVRALEAVYALDRPEGPWLRGVVDALRPGLEDGLGMAAYIYDASVRPLAIREPILDCPLDGAGLSAVVGRSDESYVRGAWLAKVAATASETPGFAEHPGVREIFHPVGIHDVLVVNALDPLGVGCLIGAPLRRLRRLRDAERERWERVGAHVQAALRLRLRLKASAGPAEEGASGGVEAVLARGGKVEHLEPPAERAGAALRDAVLAMDRARRFRRKPDRALASWRALVRARWTLVHDFEAGGDRYIVARANAASATGPQVLSARERQVVGCLALGHSPKVIAYELGLSHSTVRVLLARATAKLGARDRADLIEKFRAG